MTYLELGGGMKVFLSWSGPASHKAAQAFREWLPLVVQPLEPYISSTDIAKGEIWGSSLAGELEGSNYGIIFVTRSNLKSPWLNFEAGAISKYVDQARVSPLLLGLKRAEVEGPLVRFQSTINERGDIQQLTDSLNDAVKSVGEKSVDEKSLGQLFDVLWPRLEATLTEVEQEAENEPAAQQGVRVTDNEMLEELLELARGQQRMLHLPAVLPSFHRIESLFQAYSLTAADHGQVESLYLTYRHLQELLSGSDPAVASARRRLKDMGRSIGYLKARVGIPTTDDPDEMEGARQGFVQRLGRMNRLSTDAYRQSIDDVNDMSNMDDIPF